MAKRPISYDLYFATTNTVDVHCPLCGAKRFHIEPRLNGQFIIHCLGRKHQRYDEDRKLFTWQHNYCPWEIWLSKGDFVRAALAKATHEAKFGIALRGRKRKERDAKEHREGKAESSMHLFKRVLEGDISRPVPGASLGECEERDGGEWEERELGQIGVSEMVGDRR